VANALGKLKRRTIPRWLSVLGRALSFISNVQLLMALGYALVVFATGAAVIGRGLGVGWPLLIPIASGVTLLAAGSIWAALTKRQRRTAHEEGREHTAFLTAMSGIRRRYGSNIQSAPRERQAPMDWRAELIREGEQHLRFLDRVSRIPHGTTAPEYLKSRELSQAWCESMFKFASARDIDHTHFRDFPVAFGWDQYDQVRAAIEQNIAALNADEPQSVRVERVAG
jgi:hypothetical protein